MQQPQIKMEDKAELEVIKHLLENLQSLIGDDDKMGDKPVEIEITKLDPSTGDDMEKTLENALHLPPADDKADPEASTDEGAVVPGEEDDLDLDSLRDFIGRG